VIPVAERNPLLRTAAAVAAAAVVALVVTLVLDVPAPFGGGGGMGPGHGMGGGAFADMTVLLRLKVALATFNAALLLVLTWNYLVLYRELPNRFTGSLILFSAALFGYAVSSNPVLHVLFGFRGGPGIGAFTFLPDLFAAVAVVVILYQSYQ
jgi:hypothetical protein